MLTKGAFLKSSQMNSLNMTNATFLPGLDFGPSPCNGRDLDTRPESGRDHARASRSVAPALAKAPPTSGTCGRFFAISSSPAAHELCLESKSPAPPLSERLGEALQSRLSRFGSMEYEQTWKLRVTPLGLRYWAHTASGRRTSGKGCTGSPTPRANDAEKRGEVAIDPRNGLVSFASLAGHPTPSSEGSAGEISEDLERVGSKFRNRKTGRVLQTNLATDTLMLCGHPTPNTPSCGENSQREGRGAGGADLEEVANLAGHPSPRVSDEEQTGPHRGQPDTLPSCSGLAGHPTCSARDWKDTPGMAQTGINPDGTERSRLDMLPRVASLAGHQTPTTEDAGRDGSLRDYMAYVEHGQTSGCRLRAQAHGATPSSTATSTAKTGGYRLNPGFSLWLMIGIPTIVDVWASCGVRGMLSFRRSRRNS